MAQSLLSKWGAQETNNNTVTSTTATLLTLTALTQTDTQHSTRQVVNRRNAMQQQPCPNPTSYPISA
jgi:hypothetical protein